MLKCARFCQPVTNDTTDLKEYSLDNLIPFVAIVHFHSIQESTIFMIFNHNYFILNHTYIIETIALHRRHQFISASKCIHSN